MFESVRTKSTWHVSFILLHFAGCLKYNFLIYLIYHVNILLMNQFLNLLREPGRLIVCFIPVIYGSIDFSEFVDYHLLAKAAIPFLGEIVSY